MNTTRHTARFLAPLAIAASAAIAGPPAQPDALRGPSVREHDAPRGARFDNDAHPGRALEPMADEARRTAAFMRAVRALNAPDTDPALRLTPTQEREVRGILRKHHEAVRAFRHAHAEDFRLLREQSPRRRQRVESDTPGPDAGAQPAPVDPGALRERIVALREAAPDAVPAKEAVWAALTEPQRRFVQRRMAEIQADAAARRDAIAQPAPEDAEPPQSARPRTRERLGNLPPEQRRRALELARQKQRERRGATDKPAPTMDDVAVPPPPGP